MFSTHSVFQRYGFPFLAVSMIVLLISMPAAAQVAGGTILGAVTDPSGAVIPNAQISIRETAKGIVHTAKADSAGFFSVPNLAPGSYDVSASASGFAETVAKGITLTVGAQQTVNLTMKVGEETTTVTVADAAPGVQLVNSTLSDVVDDTTVRELPLNGRDWTQLATFQPGISQVRNQDTIGGTGGADVARAARGLGNQLTVSGARPQQNSYRLDGININDYTNGAPGGSLGTLSGVDAIQEFSVLTNNYSAEYGKSSGGVINAITRSGSNQFHGDAYEFLRNSALDARNYFDGATVPPFRRNQFGGAVGGPIVKDKTFFFFNYEGLRQSLSTTQQDSVPSLNARNGILSSGNVTVAPNIAPYLALWPLPNGPILGAGDTAIARVVTLQTGTENFYTARVDHHFSGKDTLSGEFLYDKSLLSNPDALNATTFSNRNSSPFVSIEETHVFSPAVVNTLRFGFNRNGSITGIFAGANLVASNKLLGAIPNQYPPFIGVTGLTTFDGGPDGFPNYRIGWNSFQLYDDAFMIHGSHSLKFGFVVERMQSNNFVHFFEDGRFAFTSLSAFLTNQPFHFNASLASDQTERGLRASLFGGYFQDDWRLKPNLTINLGLRYEMSTVPTEVNNRLPTLRSVTDSVAHLGSPYFNNPTLRNFDPRVGFAWDPFHHGKTSVRGGFGVFDVLPLPYLFLLKSSASAPFSHELTVSGTLPVGSFPTQAYQILLNEFPPTSLAGNRVSFIQPNPSRSYVMQWNLNIQQQVAPSTFLTLAYVGSRGVHLPLSTDDAGIVIPTATTNGYRWPLPIGSGTVLNPNVGQLDMLEWEADSHYDALQVQVSKKLSHDVQFQGSYTWGKSIDSGSSSIAGDQFSNSPSSLPLWFDPRFRRGQSDFNLGQSLVISGTWDIGGTQPRSGVTGWAISGWEVGGIYQASSGAPFTLLLSGDPLGMKSSSPVDYPDRLSISGCGSLVNPGNVSYVKTQCFAFPNPVNRLGNAGRNPLTGPGLSNLDFSLFKNSYIPRLAESANLQFRAEFFNILNRTNFSPPLDNNTIFTANGALVGGAGLIDSTQTSSRQIQFGLKFIW